VLRGLLEFRDADLGGRRVRFNSPQGYDAGSDQSELQALAALLQ
jgi:hypothetical protein